MIVKKEIHKEEDGTDGYIECIFNSSNILYSVYFLKTKILYISFNSGIMYSYSNVDNELYNKFETSESQGKFFVKEIKNNKKYPYAREFTLFQYEVDDAKKVIKEWKDNQQ